MSAEISEAELLRNVVFNFVRRSGAAGLTDEEVSFGLDLDGSTVRHRRLELVKEGLLVNCGLKRKTESGRGATVWMDTDVAKKVGRIHN